MITNFLFLLGPLLSGVWWGRERHTWSCGGESAPEKAGGDQRWLVRAAWPLIGHQDLYWLLIGWLAPHCLVSTGHWILDFCFARLQGAAAAPVSGAGCCDSLLGSVCVCGSHNVSSAMVTSTIVTMETPASRDSLGLNRDISPDKYTVKQTGGQSPVYTEAPHFLVTR